MGMVLEPAIMNGEKKLKRKTSFATQERVWRGGKKHAREAA